MRKLIHQLYDGDYGFDITLEAAEVVGEWGGHHENYFPMHYTSLHIASFYGRIYQNGCSLICVAGWLFMFNFLTRLSTLPPFKIVINIVINHG